MRGTCKCNEIKNNRGRCCGWSCTRTCNAQQRRTCQKHLRTVAITVQGGKSSVGMLFTFRTNCHPSYLSKMFYFHYTSATCILKQALRKGGGRKQAGQATSIHPSISSRNNFGPTKDVTQPTDTKHQHPTTPTPTPNNSNRTSRNPQTPNTNTQQLQPGV